ncbi:MAG TPA: hypothetical protein VGY77_05685 [Gemmataceae bacterium]|nr:hypothetical protein [Gemmataceae bacterium]
MKHRITGLLLAAAFLAPPLRAEDMKPIGLTLRPAPAPTPSLKYKLLPELEDQSPGNAALLYYRAYSPEWQTYKRDPEIYDKLDKWLSTPVKELPRQEVNWILQSQLLKEVDLAARREFCNWELTARLRKESFRLLLPDIQGFRDFAKLLSVRARLEMAEGNYDNALYTLQSGYSLGRHLGEGPTLIIGLVGLAIGSVMTEQVETFIQQPDAPNLYWALTALPRPLVDLRKPFEGEKLNMDSAVPDRKELETVVMSPEQMQAKVDKLIEIFQLGEHGPPTEAKIYFTALVLKNYSHAKRYLIDQGRKRELIEAMPAPQVVLIYSLNQFDRLRDGLFKWYHVPYWEVHQGLRQAEEDIRNARETMEEGIPLASTLLPALQKVHFAQARLDRRIAALRCVEAIRLHAAAHDGQMPFALKEITEVPIPIDPVTGREFDYRREGTKAILSAAPPPGEAPASFYSLRYEITLKK